MSGHDELLIIICWWDLMMDNDADDLDEQDRLLFSDLLDMSCI